MQTGNAKQKIKNYQNEPVVLTIKEITSKNDIKKKTDQRRSDGSIINE